MTTTIETLRKLLAEATPGPVLLDGGAVKTVGLLDPEQPKRGREIIATVNHSPNAAFITAIYNAAGDLLDAAERAERYEKALKTINDAIGEIHVEVSDDNWADYVVIREVTHAALLPPADAKGDE